MVQFSTNVDPNSILAFYLFLLYKYCAETQIYMIYILQWSKRSSFTEVAPIEAISFYFIASEVSCAFMYVLIEICIEFWNERKIELIVSSLEFDLENVKKTSN